MIRTNRFTPRDLLRAGILLGLSLGAAFSSSADPGVVEGMSGSDTGEVSVRYRCEDLDCVFEAVVSETLRPDVIEYEWNLGDGTTLQTTDARLRHRWGEAGPKFVSLSVHDRYCDVFAADASLSVSTTASPPDTLSPQSVRLGQDSTRAVPEPLQGATVDGKIFAFVEPPREAHRVVFRLSGPKVRNRRLRVEWDAPFDLAGGSVASAQPFDTRKLADGAYRLQVIVVYRDRSSERVFVDFEVRNRSAVPELVVSSSADRVGSDALVGTVVAGEVYLQLSGAEDARSVRFFLDDPTRNDKPLKIDWRAPWDVKGGSARRATPFDTRQLPNGRHVLSAEIVDSATPRVVHASFTVAN